MALPARFQARSRYSRMLSDDAMIMLGAS